MVSFDFREIGQIAHTVEHGLARGREAGGLLAGPSSAHVSWALPAVNAAVEPSKEFTIAYEQLDGLLATIERRGYELQGTFHSHPGEQIARLSRVDAAMAEHTGLALVIATGRPGEGWDWGLWDPTIGTRVEFRIAPPRATIAPRCPVED